MINIASLQRNPKAVLASLVTLPDGRVVTKTGCKIHLPCRFAERGLANIGVDNYIVGLYAIIVGDAQYAISMVNAMLNIDPTETVRVKINQDDYFEFIFPAGSTVLKSTSIVKTDSLVSKIYDEVFSKGNVPWYFTYDDLAFIFDTSKEYAGANIGTNNEVTELIASIVARNSKDKTKYYRSTVKSAADVKTNPPAYISLRDVTFAPTNTTNRMGGSYMSTGIIAALNNPSDRTERIESLLRK